MHADSTPRGGDRPAAPRSDAPDPPTPPVAFPFEETDAGDDLPDPAHAGGEGVVWTLGLTTSPFDDSLPYDPRNGAYPRCPRRPEGGAR